MLRNLFGKQLIPTVRFNPTRVTDTVIDDVLSTLDRLAIVPSNHRAEIVGRAIESVQRGGDLAQLCRAMEAIGISKANAAHAAMHINRRASSIMQTLEWERLGITEAKWLWSGAPCLLEAAEAHREASGKRYKVSRGMMIGGRYTGPGMDDGCKCVAFAVVPGFN